MGTAGGVAATAEENIREVARVLVKINGHTAQQMADLLGFSKPAWHARLAGGTRFTTADVAVMAHHFGVPPQCFYDGPAALLRVDVPLRNAAERATRRYRLRDALLTGAALLLRSALVPVA